MKKHKWQNNVCQVCGIRKEEKSERVSDGYGFKKRFYTVYYVCGVGTLKRPVCINPNQLKMHFGYDLSD